MISNKNNRADQQRPLTQALHETNGLSDVFYGVILQAARKYLFADVRFKAFFYLFIVFTLSCVANYFPNLETFYFIQRHNIFNRYGTKLGWFWSCLFTIPFIFLTSYLQHGSPTKALRDLMRMVVSTFIWSYSTQAFLHYEQYTAKCHGAEHALRHTCDLEGGKWVSGFDISGHTFLLIYSILVMSEEASSFRYWPKGPFVRNQDQNPEELQSFQKYTKYIQNLFIALFLLHLLWDIQLIITTVYYHQFLHKITGALIALFFWFITYRVWYPLAFPFLPIRRHKQSKLN